MDTTAVRAADTRTRAADAAEPSATDTRAADARAAGPRAAGPDPDSRAVTRLAAAGLALLLPFTFAAWFLVLASERGTRCLMYGEGCSPVPGDLLWAFFCVALGSGVLALTWPRAQWRSARRGIVGVQWGAQLLLVALILSGA